jgi:bifunctional DNase/RNase
MMETAELIPVKFDKVKQSKTYTCIVLGTEKKKFAIYTDPQSGKAMQTYLTESEKPRPATHDLLMMIFRGLDIKIRQVVINDLQDTIYFARLFLEQKNGDILNIVEIDARPSDCITLALINKVPVYCTKDVLDRVVPVADE